MNYDNLHELINRYEEKLDLIYGEEHDELFKWMAMKVWRDEWFKPESTFDAFADRFNAARKEFSLFMDNSRMHPSTGVIKLWEKEPETVEHLFYDVLFADTKQDPEIAQNNMERFLDEYEKLRQKYFAGNWSYKQDRHSASVFMAMNEPSFNYVFKSTEAATMAKYVDFGFSIGAGMTFSLPNYYRLCDEIVAALREHDSLLEKHFDRLRAGNYYVDESLHLLAFDLMYCCRTYNYYKGLVVPLSGKTIKSGKPKAALTAEELAALEAAKEAERLEKIDALEQEIAELERSYDGCEDISLLGVQVTAKAYGTGIVVAQEINKITVRFAEVEKTFILDKKFSARPRFEDDEQIVEAFTVYGRAIERIRRIQKELDALQKD